MLTKLKILRVEKGMSQSDLAQALGTTQVTVSAWETGRSTQNSNMLNNQVLNQ